MKKETKTGLVIAAVYLGYALAVTIYTSFFCPNIYCEAFNVLAVLPWSFFFEMQARNPIVFTLLVIANIAILFLAGFFISRKIAK